jgi:hypothetical protein
MRIAGISALLLTTALATSAAAQQGSTLSVVPSDSGVTKGGQEYMLILVPRTGQSSTESTPTQARSDSGRSQGPTTADSASGRSQAERDIENFVRQVYERGYMQGRLAERRRTGAQLSQGELERLGRQLFVRGYVQGRYEESIDGDRGQQQETMAAAQRAVKEARQALREGDYAEARRAMRRADRALPNNPADERMSQTEGRTGSISSRLGSGSGDQRGVNRTQQGAEPSIADRAPPGTITGELPIPIPGAQSDGSPTGQNPQN